MASRLNLEQTPAAAWPGLAPAVSCHVPGPPALGCPALPPRQVRACTWSFFPRPSTRSCPPPAPGAPNHLPERSSRVWVLPMREGAPTSLSASTPQPLLGPFLEALFTTCSGLSVCSILHCPLHDGLPTLLQQEKTRSRLSLPPQDPQHLLHQIEISSQPRTYIFITCDSRIFSGLPW